jgi:hypothetical protein
MRRRLADRTRRRLRIAAVSAVVLVGAMAGGRVLLGTTTARSSSQVSRAGIASNGVVRSSSPVASSGSSVHAGSSAGTSVTATPVQPIGPDVVRTATVDLRVGRGVLATQMSKIASLATTDGGYVDSSSMSGGTARSAPVVGLLVVRVPATHFDDVLARLATLGKVNAQQVSGQDVTGQVAENAATISVLQQEVNLLQSKLSQTTDISTFLQIEGQLAPVQQQLQQLESQQTVLQGSVAFATVTVDLTAPGAPVPVGPQPLSHANAARAAWHYAGHNTLVVLDGLAVAGGWALPLLVLAGLGWLIVTKVLRRRRPGMTPA